MYNVDEGGSGVKWFARVMSVALIGIVAAFALSELPDWREDDGLSASGGDRAKAAFALTEANLVDRIGGIALQTELARVSLHHSVLALELRANPPDGAGRIFADLAELCRFAFEETDNIGHLLVRVVDGNRRLLLSMDASRTRWPDARADLQSAARGTDSANWEEAFGRHFSMQYAPAWRNMSEGRFTRPEHMR
mgnify:CR=1 FL=1